jgi:hypothetical protein
VKLGLSAQSGEHRLREFKDRVLRRIFGSKREEVIGIWRKLHNEGALKFVLFKTYY